MMTQKKHIALKKLIQASGPDKPAPGFTEMVMKDIRSDVMMEITMDAVLKSKLKEHATENLAPEIPKNIMAQVKQQNISKAANPIIPNYIWIGISAFFGIFLVFLAASSSNHVSTSRSILQRYFTAPVSNTVSQIPSEYLIILIAVSLLFMVDYLFHTKVYKQNKS